jgi:hypothetical protein
VGACSNTALPNTFIPSYLHTFICSYYPCYLHPTPCTLHHATTLCTFTPHLRPTPALCTYTIHPYLYTLIYIPLSIYTYLNPAPTPYTLHPAPALCTLHLQIDSSNPVHWDGRAAGLRREKRKGERGENREGGKEGKRGTGNRETGKEGGEELGIIRCLGVGHGTSCIRTTGYRVQGAAGDR